MRPPPPRRGPWGAAPRARLQAPSPLTAQPTASVDVLIWVPGFGVAVGLGVAVGVAEVMVVVVV